MNKLMQIHSTYMEWKILLKNSTYKTETRRNRKYEDPYIYQLWHLNYGLKPTERTTGPDGFIFLFRSNI